MLAGVTMYDKALVYLNEMEKHLDKSLIQNQRTIYTIAQAQKMK